MQPETEIEQAARSGHTPAESAAAPVKLRGHIPALDGLRGLAILMVLLHHFTPVLPPTYLALAYARIMSGGWMGVDLFFVLSGFLITGILLDSRGDPRLFRNFYARRSLRIFPLYLGLLVLVFIVLPPLGLRHVEGFQEVSRHQGWLWLYGTNIYMALHGAMTFQVGAVQLNHLWSLAVEEHFYLVWPLLVAFLARRRMIAICIAFLVFGLCLRVGLYFAHVNTISCYVLTPCRMDALAMGGLLAYLARSPSGDGLHKFVRSVRPFAVLGALSLAAAFVVFKCIWWYMPSMATWGFTVTALLSGYLLASVVIAPPATVLSRFCRSGVMRFLGKYSYGLYVLHFPLMPFFQWAFPVETLMRVTRVPLLGIGIYATLSISCTVAAALLSYHLFERHFLVLKRYFAPSDSGREAADSASGRRRRVERREAGQVLPADEAMQPSTAG